MSQSALPAPGATPAPATRPSLVPGVPIPAIAHPTTDPSPPPSPPAYCNPAETLEGSVGTLASLPALHRREDGVALAFGETHDMSPTTSGWPYLQSAYNARRHETLAVWTQESIAGGYQTELYIQRLDDRGAPAIAPTRLPTGSSQRIEFPRVAYNPDADSYLVAWTDSSNGASYLSCLNGDGSPQGEVSTLAENAYMPRLVYNPARREYLAAWQDSVSSPGCSLPLTTVRARRLDASGAPLGEPIALGGSLRSLYSFTLALDPKRSRYLLLLCSSEQGYGLYTRLFDGEGKALGSARSLPLGPQPQANGNPVIAYHPTRDDFMVIWGDGSYDRADVFACRLDHDGAAVGAPIRVTDDVADERPSQLMPFGDGYLATVARRVTIPAGLGEITYSSTTFGQRLDEEGLRGPEVGLDSGSRGMAIAPGEQLDRFLVFARSDRQMTAQQATLRRN